MRLKSWKNITAYGYLVEEHRPRLVTMLLPRNCKICDDTIFGEKAWKHTAFYFHGFEDPYTPQTDIFCLECCKSEEEVVAKLRGLSIFAIEKLKREAYDSEKIMVYNDHSAYKNLIKHQV